MVGITLARLLALIAPRSASGTASVRGFRRDENQRQAGNDLTSTGFLNFSVLQTERNIRMKRIFGLIRSLHREAAWEAARNVFAILGVGATLANIATMRLWMMAPATALVVMTWFGFYKLYDVPSVEQAGNTIPTVSRTPEILHRTVQPHSSPDPAKQSYRPFFASVPTSAKSDYPRAG